MFTKFYEGVGDPLHLCKTWQICCEVNEITYTSHLSFVTVNVLIAIPEF